MCEKCTKRKSCGNNYFNKLFMFSVITLAVYANIIIPHHVTSSKNSNISCGNRTTCTQCVEQYNCNWLFDKQNCVDRSSDIFSEYLVINSISSCPQFFVRLDREEANKSFFSIMITVSQHSDNVTTYLSNSNILCNVENKTYKTSLSNSNGTIKCSKVQIPHTSREIISVLKENPLNIFYFTVSVNGVQLHFDNEADYYVTINTLSCTSSRCVVSYWNDESRKYYCKWCWNNYGCIDVKRQQSKCDIRATKDNLVIAEPTGNIEVKGPNVKIEHFEPTTALSFDDTEMSIFITNHTILKENLNVIISVAGRDCKDPREVSDVEGITHLKCNVTAGINRKVADGPVVVVYLSSSTNYTLASEKNFKFVNPLITSVKPTCGPVEGGTKINITGEFLNVAKNVQIKIGSIVCKIIESSSDHVFCLTGKSAEPTVDRFKITLNTIVRVLYASFTYANSPTVESGQNLTGIASGGTKIQILGSFACVENPGINVDYQGSSSFEKCELIDVKKILCPTPKLKRIPDQTDRPISIPFILQMDFAGRTQKRYEENKYQIHPDPIFSYFEVTGTRIRIHGTFLHVGYRPEELTIQDQNSTEKCNVIFVNESYIDCQVSSVWLADSIQILGITVGAFLKTVVVRKSNPINSRQFQIATVLSGISIVSVFVALIFGMLFCYKIILTNSKHQTEKRYMEELRNITAGLEGSKF